MDIAAFVGLASSGPVDLPVVVEDAERFREVFGADLPLAIDATSGRMATAHLGQSGLHPPASGRNADAQIIRQLAQLTSLQEPLAQHPGGLGR